MEYADEQYELIKASQAGDQAAVSKLVSLHAPAVYGFLFHLCRDRVLSEDLAQETFLRALQALKKYQFRAPFRAWLFRIAVNLFRDDRRRSTVRKLIDSDVTDQENLHLVTMEPGPDAVLEQKERTSELYRALDQLPHSLRLVIVMRDLQEMSYSEISEALDWRPGTVKSRLFRARQELAELMRPFGEDQR
jgi:RNA polymerase sigma-70 factor, ECF subfamily